MSRLIPLEGLALATALVLGAALLLDGGGRADAPQLAPVYTSPQGGYSITTPAGWKPVAEGAAATVLERSDKRGMVVIRRRPPLVGPLATLAGRLERTLARQLPDFRPAGVRQVTVGGKQALVYTFVRPRANQVQSVVIAPAGNRSYTLDLVADGDAPDVARELADMVRSFAPRR